ncbi:hypothetical protein JCM10213_008399 [Rhodosporidiobolus nylandii]
MVSLSYLLKRDYPSDRLSKRAGIGGARGGGFGGGGFSGGGRSSGGGSSSSGRSSGGSSSSGRSGTGSSSSSPGSSSVGRTGNPGSSSSTTFGTYGGGTPRTISAGAPFAGRNFGGATRGDIYGGRGYGGGYGRYAGYGAAGAGLGLGYGYVAGLGFPYGYWPLYLGPHYYGDDEYGPYSNSSRPGGSLAVTSLSPPDSDTQSPPQYMLYGDAESLTAATNSLVANCSAVVVVSNTAVNDDGAYVSNPTAAGNSSQALLPSLDPTNVLSYYRASSFALYAFFTDVASAAPSNASANFTAPSSAAATYLYPPSARNSDFESCLNSTISGALPIEEGYADDSSAAAGLAGKDGQSLLLVAALAAGMAGGARWQTVLVLIAVLAVAAQA